MATANDLRVGKIINHNGKLWRILKTDHVKPGKGGAFVQVEMKELKVGTKANERLRSDQSVDIAHFEERKFQYLFSAGDVITLMNTETYEQLEINSETFSGQEVFLQDGMEVTLEYAEETLISASVPNHVILEITETEGVVKGQTATSSNKPATMENSIRVMVPQFINSGDKIVVHTADNSYVKRAE